MKIITNKILVILALVTFQAKGQDFPYHYFSHSFPVVANPSMVAASTDMEGGFGAYSLWAGGYKPVNDYLVSLSLSPDLRNRRRYNRKITRVGVGLNLMKEQLGPFNQNIIQLMYSYHIPLSQEVQLSLGVAGIIENLHIDVNSLSPGEPGDPRLAGGNNQSWMLDGGFGATIITSRFMMGFSVLHMAPGTFRFFEQHAEEINSWRRLFLTGSYLLPISGDAFIRPQVTLRNSRIESVHYDAALDIGLHYFDVGGGYRSENSVFLSVRIPFSGFWVSYTSENPLKASHLAGNGHSLTLGWKL